MTVYDPFDAPTMIATTKPTSQRTLSTTPAIAIPRPPWLRPLICLSATRPKTRPTSEPSQNSHRIPSTRDAMASPFVLLTGMKPGAGGCDQYPGTGGGWYPPPGAWRGNAGAGG